MTEQTVTRTKTFTPEQWFEFQKQDAVVDVIDMETIVNMPGYKEVRITFTWNASKANQ